MAQHETILNFMSINWDIVYYSDPEEAYVESITVKEGEELIDFFTDYFIAELNEALLVQLEAEASAARAEDAAQQREWRKQNENL